MSLRSTPIGCTVAAVLALLCLCLHGFCATASAAPCASSPADEAQVVAALRAMYTAATADDLDRFHAVAAADFYAYDNGKRFDGDALMALIKTLHTQGNVFVWQVNDPEVHIDCDMAWITYVNRGSLRTATQHQPLTWLESAVLQRQSGVWRIQFFHSTRVP